jgi:hypothetical protein
MSNGLNLKEDREMVIDKKGDEEISGLGVGGQEGGNVGDPRVPSCSRFSEIVQKDPPASILI